MRQLNFVIIFVVCLALVLFGIQNTEPVAIKIVDGVQVQAPLSIELIVAMGVGAVLAWIFSVWTRLQQLLNMRQEVRVRETRIHELEQDIERYKAEIQERPLLPAADAMPSGETAEAFAQ
jgi:uncharacterized integral membrane protein